MSRQNRRVCRSLRALALLPVVLASPCRAVEEPLCVSNATELRQALLEAAASGFDYDIRLRPGVYFTGGQAFSYSVAAHGLSISGGWSDDHDPCDVQDPHADATILDGQGASAILKLVATGDAPGTHLAIGNLTLRNGGTSIDGEAAGLALYGALHQELRVQNVAVLGSHNTTAQPQIATSNVVTLSGYADIYFINNVFADNTSAGYAALAFFTVFQEQTAYVHNNTLSLGASFALLHSDHGTAFRFVNNAVLGQVALDGFDDLDPVRVWFFSNLGQWSGFAYNASVQADVGNDRSINPGFMAPLDFRPAANSPLVNRGLSAPGGGSSNTDLDGRPRVDLGFIDVGAFESTRERIFANAFD